MRAAASVRSIYSRTIKKPLPSFDPGQYLTFRLDIPGQSKPVMRCYSLSDNPKPEFYRVSIKAAPPPLETPDAPPGLSSNYFHDYIQEGDILDVKAPGGHFFLDTGKHTPVVLIGGGIGLTPVLSMVNQIVKSGSMRETHLFYGVRNGAHHVMKKDLRRIARKNRTSIFMSVIRTLAQTTLKDGITSMPGGSACRCSSGFCHRTTTNIIFAARRR